MTQKRSNNSGFSLLETLVVLMIVSVLATVALPYAQAKVITAKEQEVKVVLQKVRNAIDEFHTDWKDKKIANTGDYASTYGYPLNLKILVEGVEYSDFGDVPKKYLRKLPQNPFAKGTATLDEQWKFISYSDAHDATFWSGEDVYDIKINSEKEAINGSYYKDW